MGEEDPSSWHWGEAHPLREAGHPVWGAACSQCPKGCLGRDGLAWRSYTSLPYLEMPSQSALESQVEVPLSCTGPHSTPHFCPRRAMGPCLGHTDTRVLTHASCMCVILMETLYPLFSGGLKIHEETTQAPRLEVSHCKLWTCSGIAIWSI